MSRLLVELIRLCLIKNIWFSHHSHSWKMSLCLTKSWTWLEFVLFAKKYPVFLPLIQHVNVPGSCVKYLALSPQTQLDISLKISCLDASNRAEIVPTSCKIYPFFLTVTQLEMTWCLVENIWFGCFNLSKTITSFWMNSPSSALSTFRALWSVAGLIITKAFFFFFLSLFSRVRIDCLSFRNHTTPTRTTYPQTTKLYSQISVSSQLAVQYVYSLVVFEFIYTSWSTLPRCCVTVFRCGPGTLAGCLHSLRSLSPNHRYSPLGSQRAPYTRPREQGAVWKAAAGESVQHPDTSPWFFFLLTHWRHRCSWLCGGEWLVCGFIVKPPKMLPAVLL